MDIDRIREILAGDDVSELETYLTTARDHASGYESAQAKIAQLTAQLDEVIAERDAVKAHNYDLLVSAGAPSGDTDPADDDDGDDDGDSPTLDDYFD